MGKIVKMRIPTILLKLGYSIQSTFHDVNPITEYKFLNSVDFSRISGEIRGKSLDEIVVTHPLGKRLYIDATALKQASLARQYHRLEKRLVDYVRDFKSQETFASTIVSGMDDRLSTTLDYVNHLKNYFKVDPKKVENLQVALFKASIPKMEKRNVNLKWLLPSKYHGIYDRAERDYRKERTALTPVGH